MKINNDISRTPPTTDSATSAKSGGSVSPATKSAHATTAIGSVSISEASRSLQTAGTRSAEAPFDAKRVDAIKSAISAGHFRVNPEAIADKVLDSASQLLVGKS